MVMAAPVLSLVTVVVAAYCVAAVSSAAVVSDEVAQAQTHRKRRAHGTVRSCTHVWKLV